ncbi:MAG: extracellular solute-binding protein, partial [Anaerolineae bacterium]|nr:extracellular solute-binding protein [Anaerolineae bacterium]
DYVLNALSTIQSDGLDAHSALQQAEATAASNLQTAASLKGTEAVLVVTPIPEVVMQPGEVTLNFGYASFIQPMPNQEQWDQLMRDFETSDPQVGKINMETEFGNASDYASRYDCFYLPYNAVPNIDTSTVLSLDPYLDADPTFDRNDVVGNALSLIQKDNKTWALPIIIQPEVLRYNTDMFAQAGVPAPTNGWTIDQFNDALRALKPSETDPTPFVSRSPGVNYLLELIVAYGGIPLDRRTDPPTINFTDPTNLAAIQQVLDLAKNGYISYQELARTSFMISIDGEQDPEAIYTESLNGFSIRRGGRRLAQNGEEQDPSTAYAITTYPSGSQYNAVSYDIGTAYISATTQNADACYRWLNTLAQQPELFSAMPARRSFINDPAFVASQGADTIAVYNQFDQLMTNPNTINFQSPFAGDSNPGNFLVEFWLTRAFDNYVLKDADLNAELTEAQTYST